MHTSESDVVHQEHPKWKWMQEVETFYNETMEQVEEFQRFMQGERTYETYIQDDREGQAKTFPSYDFPEIGTGKATERIVPLYIGYRGRGE